VAKPTDPLAHLLAVSDPELLMLHGDLLNVARLSDLLAHLLVVLQDEALELPARGALQLDHRLHRVSPLSDPSHLFYGNRSCYLPILQAFHHQALKEGHLVVQLHSVV